ncbi:HEPN domain-containing protein [Paenibacillus sp. P32E]|uniref:HEPN domain-containing protein n=1 Tax=Paenibacillus sp. P32E TaxID=1349434 RepID=UPI00093A9224|nr:HEPN domain-containing protein [Paenibacillus sp. P32E]OKP83732.1 hypothetical protein A3848_25985 [Paenibacillus sp. P32E]
MQENLSSCFLVEIHVILFGVDEKIFDINLLNDYRIERMSLVPNISHLDEIFNVNAIELRRSYNSAVIDSSLNIACAIKKYQIVFPPKQANDSIEALHQLISNELTILDNQIRTIRLIAEQSIRFKEFVYNIYSMTSNNTKTLFLQGKAPLQEAYSRPIASSLTKEEAEFINKTLGTIKIPFEDQHLNQCYLLYDLSYHQLTYANALLLLITCLEMLFLIKGDFKKIDMSKRCAVFISQDQQERLIIFSKLKNLYSKRSNFVHEGNVNIQEKDIIYLRECVRKSILKYLEYRKNKKDIIAELKNEIILCRYFPV